jgi:hypothetical protein
VSSGLILLVVFAVPYVALNLWRLARGRRWAFTFCHVMKEWDQDQQLKRAAARADRKSSDSASGQPIRTASARAHQAD